MFKLKLSSFLITIISVIFSQSVLGQVNGWEELIGEIPIIHVYGSDYEMGYALGYLDGDRWNDMMENDVISIFGTVTYELVNNQYYDYFSVPQRLENIAQGVIDGVSARSDSAIYSEKLGRDFTVVDFHVSNSITDICAIIYKDSRRGCTSLTAWEDATLEDPELQGAPAMARNYDGSYSPVMNRNTSLIALNPDDGNQTALCGWSIGLDCSSGMNEYGICLTRNASNHEFASVMAPLFVPIGYATLLGLIEEDFDSSGTCDLEDLITAITCWNRAPSRLIHALSPRNLGYMGEPAVVVEINNPEGYVFRYSDDDSVLTPDHLAATNHHRLLYPPIYCLRYELLQDSITADPDMTLERFWWLMGDCSLPSANTKMTLLFLPETQKIGIAFADSVYQSWEKEPEWIEWDQLFPPEGIEGGSPSIGTQLYPISPNPCPGSFTAEFILHSDSDVRLVLYDVSGRALVNKSIEWLGQGIHSVEFSGIPSGVYYCRLIANETAFTRSVVVIDE